MTDERRGGDETDPSDWLSRQFGGDAEPVEPAPPVPAPPVLNNPLADPSPWSNPQPPQPPAQTPAASQGGFDWGLGGGQQPPTPPPPAAPTPPDPFTAPPPVAPGPPTAPPSPFPPAAPPPVAPTRVEPPASADQGWPFGLGGESAQPDPLDPAISGAPPVLPEPPADPLPWEPAATQAYTPPVSPAADSPTEAFFAREAGPRDQPPSSGIDALFGDSQFKEYEDESVLATIPFGANAPAATGAPKPKREPGAPLPKNQKVLLWVAGGVIAVLALITLFVVGTRLPDLLGAAPAVTTSPTPTPTPTATVRPVGPVAVGTYEWNELLGGECLDPYSSPWEEEFTVVDCATPHPAQLVFRGTFPPVTPASGAEAGEAEASEEVDEPYPGVDALQAQINLLCTAAGVIDLAVAGQFSDIQFQASFAATEQQWNDGDHDYYCFVSRSSGEPLTVSVAVPPPAPAAPAAPAA